MISKGECFAPWKNFMTSTVLSWFHCFCLISLFTENHIMTDQKEHSPSYFPSRFLFFTFPYLFSIAENYARSIGKQDHLRNPSTSFLLISNLICRTKKSIHQDRAALQPPQALLLFCPHDSAEEGTIGWQCRGPGTVPTDDPGCTVS